MSTIFEWQIDDMNKLLATCELDGVFPLVEKYMPRPAKVLESGCGAGRYVKYLSDRGWDVVGLEWADNTVGMVQKFWPELKVVQGDCADSPFKESTFDGIISLGVVEHWDEGPQAPLKDMLRILKPGGTAIVTVPCLNTVRRLKNSVWWYELKQPRHLASSLFGSSARPNRLNRRFKYFTDPAYGKFFEYRFTKRQFEKEIEQAGFEILEHTPFAVLDGMYHELNPGQKLIKFEDWKFQTTPLGNRLNALLSKKPFFHPHQQAVIVRKPLRAS